MFCLYIQRNYRNIVVLILLLQISLLPIQQTYGIAL